MDRLLGEVRRPPPTTVPTPRPPAAWPEDLASPQEDPNDDTHRAGFFLKQIPLASMCEEFFAGNRVFLNFLECL